MTDWPFSFGPIPDKPEDEQEWRRSILQGIAVNGPRFRHSVIEPPRVSPVPASIVNAGDV